MYYHIKNHIYMAQFRDEFIVLDTKADKYTICSKAYSDLLKKIYEKSFLRGGEKNSNCDEALRESTYIQKLLSDNIIEEKAFPYPFSIDQKKNSLGVANVDWRLPLDNKNIKINFQVIKAFIELIRINFYIKIKGLYNTIQHIKKLHKVDAHYIIPTDEDLRSLANTVNKACLIYPTRTKCLEWAATFVCLAVKRGWKCNLEVGVQNYPFMAHAWVECNGKVVMDSTDVREGLAIVLNEPFRKTKS